MDPDCIAQNLSNLAKRTQLSSEQVLEQIMKLDERYRYDAAFDQVIDLFLNLKTGHGDAEVVSCKEWMTRYEQANVTLPAPERNRMVGVAAVDEGQPADPLVANVAEVWLHNRYRRNENNNSAALIRNDQLKGCMLPTLESSSRANHDPYGCK